MIEGAHNGVTYYRVAVGQFETLAVAQPVLEELAAEIPEDAWLLHVQPEVLEEKPPAAEAPAPLEQAAPEPARFDREKVSWTMVVAFYLEQTSADTAAAQYRKQLYRTGYPVEVIGVTSEGVTRYRVVVGQFETLRAAQAARQELAAEIPRDTWLLHVQPGR